MGDTRFNQSIENYITNLIHIKARRLIGQAGYTRSDLEDIEQDLSIHIYQNLPKHDSYMLLSSMARSPGTAHERYSAELYMSAVLNDALYLPPVSGDQITEELNQKGETTKSWVTRNGIPREGAPWNAAHIRRLLDNRTYLGETVHGDKVYPGEHEAIISKDLWDKAHRAIEVNKSRTGPESRAQRPSLLRGVMRCGHCGHAMTSTYTIRKSKLYRYYLCVKAIKSGYRACPVGSIPAGEIEPAVVDQLRAIFRSLEMIANTYKASKKQETQMLEELRSEQVTLRQELQQTEEIEPIQHRLQEIEIQINEIESSRITEREIIESLHEIDPIWDTLYPIEQARIVELLVEQVTVHSDGLDVRIRIQGLHSLVTELSWVSGLSTIDL